MKVITFIKRNITLLNTISIILILCLLYEFITMKQEDSYHGMASAMLLGLLVICLITLLIDFLLRQVFKDKLVLFLTELVIAIVIPFLIYNAYFS